MMGLELISFFFSSFLGAGIVERRGLDWTGQDDFGRRRRTRRTNFFLFPSRLFLSLSLSLSLSFRKLAKRKSEPRKGRRERVGGSRRRDEIGRVLEKNDVQILFDVDDTHARTTLHHHHPRRRHVSDRSSVWKVVRTDLSSDSSSCRVI